MMRQSGFSHYRYRDSFLIISALLTTLLLPACVSRQNSHEAGQPSTAYGKSARVPAAEVSQCSIPGISGADDGGLRGRIAPLRRVKQLTFSPCLPSAVDFGDPSVPFAQDGQGIFVYGSGVLSWTAATLADSWSEFLRGSPPHWENIDLYHHDGVTPFNVETYGEEAWDVTIEKPPGAAGPILYGGVMTVPSGEKHASIDRDHWSRRTYPFTLVNGHWQQADAPLLFDPATYGWVGHNYGHQFIEDKAGTRWFFYERVVRVSGGAPALTELFMRKMISPTKADDDEIAVFKNTSPPFPATVRGADNTLMEGPRPFHAVLKNQDFYFVGFSSGQWDSSHYGINILWSRSITGPYVPYLTEDKSDLFDFGDQLRTNYALTYGPGRPAFFQADDSQWWLLFHAASLAVVQASPTAPGPGRGPFRNFFLAPVKIELGPGNIPKITISDLEP
jgi:hypothetical protein